MKKLCLIALLAGCAGGDETVSGFVDPEAVFVLEELAGAAFPARATISFPGPGKVVGEAPCNRWSARQGVPYPWIEIGDILSTKRTCADQGLEDAYFASLRSMTLVEATGNVVILSDEAKREMVFRAQK